MRIKAYIVILAIVLINDSKCRPVVLNGGEVTINGIVSSTQLDINVNFTANVKWLAIIFSND